jgi:hypothetical protein
VLRELKELIGGNIIGLEVREEKIIELRISHTQNQRFSDFEK